MDSTVLQIPLPPRFAYRGALDVFRYGSESPLFKGDGFEVKRIITLEESTTVVHISKEGDSLLIYIPNRDLSKRHESILTRSIESLFGLDDPLCHGNINIPILEHVSGVHGFFSIYEAVIHIILGQLISREDANIMRKRFTETFGRKERYKDESYYLFPDPNVVKNLSLHKLKSIGCSYPVSTSIKELSRSFADENLEDFLWDLDQPSQVRDVLSNFDGVSQWASDWISLRGLRMFEAVPSGDLFVRNAFSWFLSSTKVLPEDTIEEYCRKVATYPGSFAYRVMQVHQKLHNLN